MASYNCYSVYEEKSQNHTETYQRQKLKGLVVAYITFPQLVQRFNKITYEQIKKHIVRKIFQQEALKIEISIHSNVLWLEKSAQNLFVLRKHSFIRFACSETLKRNEKAINLEHVYTEEKYCSSEPTSRKYLITSYAFLTSPTFEAKRQNNLRQYERLQFVKLQKKNSAQQSNQTSFH